MRIIRSQTFEKNFTKYWGKQRVDREEFIKKMKEVLPPVIALQRPYYKIKMNFGEHALRIVIKYYSDIDVLIPFLITDKNDNQYGYNMTRFDIKKIITIISQNIENDILCQNYTVIEL